MSPAGIVLLGIGPGTVRDSCRGINKFFSRKLKKRGSVFFKWRVIFLKKAQKIVFFSIYPSLQSC